MGVAVGGEPTFTSLIPPKPVLWGCYWYGCGHCPRSASQVGFQTLRRKELRQQQKELFSLESWRPGTQQQNHQVAGMGKVSTQ